MNPIYFSAVPTVPTSYIVPTNNTNLLQSLPLVNLPNVNNVNVNNLNNIQNLLAIMNLRNLQAQVHQAQAQLLGNANPIQFNNSMVQNRNFFQLPEPQAQIPALKIPDLYLQNQEKQLNSFEKVASPVKMIAAKSDIPHLNLKLNSKQASLQTADTMTNMDSTSDVSSEDAQPHKEHNNLLQFLPDDPNICLEAQIKHIIVFLVNSYDKVNEERIQQERKKFENNKGLLKAFDMLIHKFSTTTKTREEMVKYILRRAFKSFRKVIKKSTQLDAKGVSSKLCQRYFNSKEEEAEDIDLDNDEDLLKLLLPFRKNSKNKTMNSSFINEVFANEEFKKDYENYLDEFSEIMDKDNKEKIKRLTAFIEECINKNSYEGIKKYKRIPWLRIWIENTKKVAVEIKDQKGFAEPNKKLNV